MSNSKQRNIVIAQKFIQFYNRRNKGIKYFREQLNINYPVQYTYDKKSFAFKVSTSI